jgi:hypothetical protein
MGGIYRREGRKSNGGFWKFAGDSKRSLKHSEKVVGWKAD